jgi:hypothetical protein
MHFLNPGVQSQKPEFGHALEAQQAAPPWKVESHTKLLGTVEIEQLQSPVDEVSSMHLTPSLDPPPHAPSSPTNADTQAAAQTTRTRRHDTSRLNLFRSRICREAIAGRTAVESVRRQRTAVRRLAACCGSRQPRRSARERERHRSAVVEALARIVRRLARLAISATRDTRRRSRRHR